MDLGSLRSREHREWRKKRQARFSVGSKITGRRGELHAYCKEIVEPNQLAAAAAQAALDETRRSIRGSENGLVD